MHCWYVGVIVVTDSDSETEAMEKFKDGHILKENGFDLYRLPGTVEEVIQQIKTERPIDGLPSTNEDDQSESQGRDEASQDNQPLPS